MPDSASSRAWALTLELLSATMLELDNGNLVYGNNPEERGINGGNENANDDADADNYDDSQVKSPGWHSIECSHTTFIQSHCVFASH